MVHDVYGADRREAFNDLCCDAFLVGAIEEGGKVNDGKVLVAKKSHCFEWLRDDYHVDYFIRTPVDNDDDGWFELTKYQRFYWSQVDEWDLVPFLPRYPDSVPLSERDDTAIAELDDMSHPLWSFSYSKPPPETVAAMAKKANDAFLERQLHLSKQPVLGPELTELYLNFLDYLRQRICGGFIVPICDDTGANPGKYEERYRSKCSIKSSNKRRSRLLVISSNKHRSNCSVK